MEEAKNEKPFLTELKDLLQLSEEIVKLKSEIATSEKSIEPEPIKPIEPEPVKPKEIEEEADMTIIAERKKLEEFNNLHEDWVDMPPCVEKTVMQLLEHFQRSQLSKKEMYSENPTSVKEIIVQLHTQIKKQELFTEKIQENLIDLERYIQNSDDLSTIRVLGELLAKIRPLHVQEIQRLLAKAKEAGKVIHGKEIILLIGETGTGKSTTIQFLAGSTMRKTLVKVEGGGFLEHITADGILKNPELKNVISSARNKSETRYIQPVTVPLKDIFGPHEFGEIMLCDAPGFGDTAGPEVDIANGVGVIEAIKGCESVKIVALSSYKSLGDRGQGIQKLAHLLINMIHRIQERLSSIFYAFTKYPSTIDISALLLDVKLSKVDIDPLLRSDNAFVTVLTDMINKSKTNSEIIDPITSDPKIMIKKLKQVSGIMYPEEVFRFSMSEETQACVANQATRDSSNVKCALKNRDIELVMYYLGRLKLLKTLLEHTAAGDIYDEAVRFVIESVNDYCAGITKKFNRALASQDGLCEEDIEEYNSSNEYLHKVQILAEHLGPNLLSPESLIQNIHSELQKRSQALMDEELSSPSVRIYFNNLGILKNSFKQFETAYRKSCDSFAERFDTLVQTVRVPLYANDFTKVAEIILQIWKCLPVLNSHLHGIVEEQYRTIFQLLLKQLNSFSERAEPILARTRLSENEVEMMKNYMQILRSARDNPALQDRISTYVDMLKEKNDKLAENVSSVNDVYNTFIEKLITYFNQINNRIPELFQSSGDRALEDIEAFINDMDAIRTIPEVEAKTAGSYYRTVESIRAQMQQLQRDVEQLLYPVDLQSGNVNYTKMARLLSRLKSAKWMNRVCPGAYDLSINRVTEELIQYFHQLADSLMKLDLSLKHPENVSVAEEIFHKIDSLSVLERSVPELKKSKDAMIQCFIESVQGNFNRIQGSFNLQDITVYQIKQELKEFEQIKREYDSLHPARLFLREHGFSDSTKLNEEINELEKRQKLELEQEYETKSKLESESSSLQCFIEQKDCSKSNQSKSAEASSFDPIQATILRTKQLLNDQEEIIEEKEKKFSSSLAPLRSIKKQYESLIATVDSISTEQIDLLRQKGLDSIESLNDLIEEKKKIIIERQNNKQYYDFNNRFDVATADIALLYTSNCEKIANVRLKELAVDTHEILKKYIIEYGVFLDREISRLFTQLTTIGSRGDLSQDLERRLEQLTSLSEYQRVFEYIEGTKKVDYCRRKFAEQYRTMSGMMEEHRVTGRNQELREQLMIAQNLMGTDHFCGGTFLNNGFGALYRQYQVEAAKDSKQAYKTVFECIARGDYVGAEKALAGVDERTANQKDMDQVKHDLQSSLTYLMLNTRKTVNVLDPKIDFHGHNENRIREINDSIEKVRMATNKVRLTGLIDKKTKDDLTQFEQEIQKLLSEMLLNSLILIDEFMKANDVFEAEQSMKNVIYIHRELSNHFALGEVTKKLNEIRPKLDSLAEQIKMRIDYQKIEEYSKKSPRDLLTKLEKAAGLRNGKYAEVHRFIFAEVQDNFETAINNASQAPIEKRPAAMQPLNYALRFLPEELQKTFKPQIDQMTKKFTEEERAYKRELKGFLENDNVDESTMKRLNELAAQYQKDNCYEPLEILRSGVIKKLDNLWKNVEDALNTENIPTALHNMQQIIKYKDKVENISEVDRVYKYVCTVISSSLNRYADTFSNIFKIAKTETVDQAFSNLILYVELSDEFPQQISELLPERILQNVEAGLKNMCQQWHDQTNMFETSMKELNIKTLSETINFMERWDNILNNMKNSSCHHILIETFSNEMKNVKSRSEMISEVKKMIIKLKQNLAAPLNNDETTRFEIDRDQHFSTIGMSLQALRSVSAEFNTILASSLPDIQKLENNLYEKVEEFKQKLLKYASQDGHSASDSDAFRMCYNHLVSFDKCIRLPAAETRQTLELAEAKIFEKVASLVKMITNAESDIQKISEALVKMKFLAENFSMFDKKINAMIDEVLKTFKTQQGSLIISQLTMVLERTDEGSRLIAEHTALSGEDWRKRREKMQKQDDLDYVIGELEGDNLATDVLRSRYKAFRQMYNDLISPILAAFNSKTEAEPNLEVLISQTKVLIGSVVQKTTDITWDHSLRDKIPEILAHIFAVWTLKNTQHYNSMRGIEASQAYLLMPHVAQVIAIFRILGIGYKTNATFLGVNVPFKHRISNDLANNLVQIGTGEGKSVVMAITACIFALVGVDVDCSCYSEYLSSRDKNDFASVFRALGVAEHIQYGTFNKLCENLLNEQCDVREKVREMIMNNNSVIDVIQTNERIRPKVLLIDEVDVFLSEKYYGGMYTPSVCLKDPAIKTLLDTLWQNRNIRTLSAIKVLPAYQACVSKFSNWMFLFDEAIKDMLAALQSFQSATYIVQNDKIVYVEGESIVENVVRGYDTIWAYYSENQKGFISAKSLEANVGVIINCGTFSYAEMPHEFAYITGVTGTLKTLAQPEKNILKKVYGINQNTYMPSVFGKSNRNYNSANDVEAVKKSEYFMRIRGEIDTMCHAERAILVFFESEEKLRDFYNSPELASIKSNVQMITEKVSAKDRELCIKRAATDGRVTLLTRTFGRGTDFICRNQRVLANGGIHVLQTFFCEELSEEYQIMGRGARQGDRGSYRMILLDSDLEWVLGADWENEIPKITGSALYSALDKARNKLYGTKCAAKEVGIEQCKRDHQASRNFMYALSKGDMATVKKFLLEQNLGANIDVGVSRTLLLMDATGSMSSLLSSTKDTVCTMFERASAVLGEKGLSKDAFAMQFAVYRNYSSRENKILEVSSWETKGSNLRTFMNTIGPEGGMGEEAIEIGLWYAAKESETQDGISQVILIGDAPANSRSDVTAKRMRLGEQYWKTTRFATETYFETELEKLKKKNIPIHAFYLNRWAEENFQKISSETGGRCEALNIFSPDGAESLTDLVTEEVLRKTAGAQGEDAVKLYREKYSKKSFIH